ncbi:MAG: hypothetical protein R2715_10750 [Ilumatobacteraceae bacterium]
MLAASTVPTTLAGHRFWEANDTETRNEQLMQFCKNAGLAAGLLATALDTGGRPSVFWRSRRAASKAAGSVATAAGAVGTAAGSASHKVAELGSSGDLSSDLASRTDHLVSHASAAGHVIGEHAAAVGHTVGEQAPVVGRAIAEHAGELAHTLTDAAQSVAGTLGKVSSNAKQRLAA